MSFQNSLKTVLITLVIIISCIVFYNILNSEKNLNFKIVEFGISRRSDSLYLPPTSKKVLKILSRLNITRPGHMGLGLKLNDDKLPNDIKSMIKKSKKKYKFNEFVSQLIPLDRELRDHRTVECQLKKYSNNLPAVSVILSFYNEPYSMIMRTVYSILIRTPKHLLTEILLIDDSSDDEELLFELQRVLPHLPKVKLIRTNMRSGLIQARTFGAKRAKGPILIIMDSHMEVANGWVEPLLEPHIHDEKIVTMPMVEMYDRDTLEFKQSFYGPYNWVGGFTWDLTYTWTETVMPNRSDVPLKTPTMLGCAFVIRKKYFEYLGFYDEELDLWGGENMELSFKVWMCGGKMYQCFCSHTAHMFRSRPYWNDEAEAKKIRNTDRVAEVWMDEYKIMYQKQTKFNNRFFGNVTKQKQLRDNLGCKSFKWFLEKIIPQMKVFI